MIHKWFHKSRYGVEQSYVDGMKWLDKCQLVEDWGCALCAAKRYRKGAYRGIDGTPGKADLIADLSTYRSKAPGIFMRHILEHNLDWRTILDNALASFTERMTLILFRDTAPEDFVIHGKHHGHVDIDLCHDDLMERIEPFLRNTQKINRDGGKFDTLFFLAKN